MPIRLWTGLPGNGKTALMVEDLVNEASKENPRPIYQHGIDGLDVPGVETLEDARAWNARDPNGAQTCDCKMDGDFHAHVIPDGALIYMDEAWKNFGHLQEARGATPPHVLALAEHRHRGIDFRWTTQMPNQLYPFARALVADHSHVVRRFGTQFIDLFTWGELNEDVKSNAKREIATRDTRRLPAHIFKKYKSATLHTIKRKLPFKVLVLPVIVVATLVVGFFAWRALQPDNLVGGIAENGAISGSAGNAPNASATAEASRPVIRTAADYAAAYSPLIAGQPWTAPAFLVRSVTADPIVICASSGDGEDGNGNWSSGSCRCVTEQGTRYHMDASMCIDQARYGPAYNPYRQVQQERSGRQERDEGAGQRPAADGRATAAPALPEGFNGDDPFQTRYGQFRGIQPPADPSFGG